MNVADHWRNWLEKGDPRHADRIRRGKALVGRISDLHLGPGIASANVTDGATHQATIRVRLVDDDVWDRVADMIAREVGLAVHLVAATFPDDLPPRMAAIGADLTLKRAHIETDCTCGDFAVPCAHAAAVAHAVGDVIAGDPWVLCTLRGRMPDTLLQATRQRWGDAASPLAHRAAAPEPPSTGDPYRSPEPLPPIRYSLERRGSAGAVALGPLPGDQDLGKAVAPLYEAGAEAAVSIATGAASIRVRLRAIAEGTEPAPYDDEDAAESDLGERIADALAEEDGRTTRSLELALGVERDRLEAELDDLAEMGVVVRTGSRKSPRWWLG